MWSAPTALGATLAILLLAGCVSGGQQSLLDGLLRPDIGQKAFRTQWGDPDRIEPVLALPPLATRWGQEISQTLELPMELWIYERYAGTELLFDDDGDLVAWKTPLGRAELRAIPAKRPR